MKTVYFVRHGETDANVGNIYQSADTPLNEKGLQQAEIVAARCVHIPFDTLVSSTMLRAQQTAQAIHLRTGKPIESSDLFIERYRPDEIAGKNKKDPAIAQIAKKWHDSIFENGQRASNGETFNDLKMRALQAFRYLEQHETLNLVVVSHGFFLRFLAATVILGRDLTPGEFKHAFVALGANNTGVSIFQFGAHQNEDTKWDGQYWKIRAWNDHAHLG